MDTQKIETVAYKLVERTFENMDATSSQFVNGFFQVCLLISHITSQGDKGPLLTTDESVLKETVKSRNLNYQSWQDFLEQKLTDKNEEKQTVRIITGSLYFLSQVRAYLMERKNENGYTKD